MSVQVKERRDVTRMKYVGICEKCRNTANALTNVENVG